MNIAHIDRQLRSLSTQLDRALAREELEEAAQLTALIDDLLDKRHDAARQPA
jgi:protein-arginine kinase activator protein McsA